MLRQLSFLTAYSAADVDFCLSQDNCPQQTNVEIIVSCNEFGHSKHHNGEMVLIKERKNEARQSHKLQIFVIPEM